MKLHDVIAELQRIEATHGNIDVALQGNTPYEGRLPDGTTVKANFMTYDSWFIVPEHYPDEGWRVNIRSWPY